MSEKTYRIGIVGLTGITTGAPLDTPLGPLNREIITSHMGSLAYMPNVEVTAICDLVPELLEKTRQTWGHRWPNIRPYTDYKEMLAREDLNILAIATSDHRHADIAVDAANAGVKAVFCEKPLATSVEDANRMIQACDDNGVVLQVDHTRRWSPIFHKVREVIRAGAIGPLSTIVANRGGRRAMVFRNGTHTFDGVVFFAESDPAQVFARLEDGFDHWDRYRGDGGKLPENDPGATGFILFRNGVRALYNGTKDTAAVNSLQLAGPEGQINFGTNDPTAELLTQDPGSRGVVTRTLLAGQYQVSGLVAAYEELIGLIENGGESSSSGREARRTVQIITGFLKSHHAGSRLVDVDE